MLAEVQHGCRSRWSRWAILVGLLLLTILSGCIADRWNWWRRPEAARYDSPSAATYSTPPAGTGGANQGSAYVGQQTNYPGYPDNHSAATYTVADVSQSASDVLEPSRVVARVGSEVILAGDVLGPINQALAPYKDKASKEELDQQRIVLFRQQLPTVVETKMLYVGYLRYMSKQAQGKDVSAALPKVWERIHEKFDSDALPDLLEKYEVETAAQLDAKMREYGWSLAKQRRYYGERNLGMAAAFEHIKGIPETTHEEMLQYYEEHASDFEFSAQARWEQLTARFDRFSSRDEAYQAMVQMGNEVALGGAQLSGVAKRSSHGFNAKDGGQYDWTNQGSLASGVLDQAVFTLPVNRLSRILEDDFGLHIIRVLERREAGRTQFTDAQVEIKKKLEEEKRRKAYEKYVGELRRDIPVWTIYDDSSTGVARRPVGSRQ